MKGRFEEANRSRSRLGIHRHKPLQPARRMNARRAWQRLTPAALLTMEYLCFAVGLACLGSVALTYGRGWIFQAYQDWRFDRGRHSAPPTGAGAAVSHGKIPTASPLRAGSVLGRLEIPRLDLWVMVMEGDDERVLAEGVGHVPGTALPGEFGNVVVAGHRDTYFRALRNIRQGDRITFTTRHAVHTYQVGSMEKVSPTDVGVLKSHNRPTLTLITCYPFGFIGQAPKRFIVQASEVLPAGSATSEAAARMPPAGSAPSGPRGFRLHDNGMGARPFHPEVHDRTDQPRGDAHQAGPRQENGKTGSS